MTKDWKKILKRVDNLRWELPRSYKQGMRVPGGVGFDINCGVRVLRTNLREEDVQPNLSALLNQMFRDVPAGLGGSGLVRVNMQEIDRVLVEGAGWAVGKGYGGPA